MSYILEALKKAEQERDIGAVPSLATPHEDERPQPRSYRWPWVIAALLSVNVVLVVLLLRDKGAEVAVTAQAPLEPRPPLAGDQSARVTQQTSEVTVSEAPVSEKAVLPENERALSAGELVVLPEPANLHNSSPASLPERELDERIDDMTTAKANSQLPSWYELPQDFRNRLDLPRLDLHAYSEEPQNRFILVNLKKYREGERLESGLVLEEILPDGMIMSYQGERFLVER
jgi:general secretion pathway protein B